MGRAAYIRRRLILMAFVLFGVTIVIFGMVRILPGEKAPETEKKTPIMPSVTNIDSLSNEKLEETLEEILK